MAGKCLTMAGNGLPWLIKPMMAGIVFKKRAGNCREWLGMSGNVWEWLEMDGNGLKKLKTPGNTWNWL